MRRSSTRSKRSTTSRAAASTIRIALIDGLDDHGDEDGDETQTRRTSVEGGNGSVVVVKDVSFVRELTECNQREILPVMEEVAAA